VTGSTASQKALAQQDEVRLVLIQHEEAAAFMATGYAKSTGKLGMCLATSGPGVIHLLNGLYEAKLDHTPLLAIPECKRPRCPCSDRRWCERPESEEVTLSTIGMTTRNGH
jgi:glyoxylate carboligase